MDGATRQINVWLGNDEGLYRAVIERVEAADGDVSDLADALKEWVPDLVRDPEPGMRSDLITWALAQVDWHELADAWIEG